MSSSIIIGGKKSLINCTYCRRDITQQCRIICVECTNVELCGDCFCIGVNVGTHESSHGYKVSNSLDFSIFNADWTAGEELLLLEAIEKCGPGNWKIVSDYIGTKTAKQVEEHYWDEYHGRNGYCLPPTMLWNGETIPTEKYIEDVVPASERETLRGYYTGSLVETYPLGEEAGRDKIKEGSRGKDKQEIQQRNLALPGGDLPGYLPLREDFDVEYDNDAENILADLEFADDDHPSEKELKLQIVQIYNKKLEERNLRKRFAIDRGIVDYKKFQLADRKRSKEERDLVAKLRLFARFQSPEDHDTLVEGILRARKLRLQIDAFQQYRRMGITTLEQARQYDIDRRKQESEQKSKKQREAMSYLFETGRFQIAGQAKSRRGPGEVDAAPDKPVAKSSSRGGAKTDDLMVSAPGADLLTAKELDLCISVPLLPMHYLAIKEAIIREAHRSGTLTLEGVKRVIRLDIDRNTKLYDFFVKDVSFNSIPAPTTTSQSLSASSSAVWDGTEDDEDGDDDGAGDKRTRVGGDDAPVKSGPGRKKKFKA